VSGADRVSSADEVLVRRLFQEHGAALLGYATRLMGDRAPAEDVVHETLIRAWHNPGALAGEKGTVRVYLFTTARDLAVARHRKLRGRAPEETEPVDDEPVDSMVLLTAMQTLSAEHREVLHSLYFQGRNIAETSATLGVPAGAVKTRSYHALKRLREAVG
jgi:RNA polymerase sigma-70 factor (ECF subfamily)